MTFDEQAITRDLDTRVRRLLATHDPAHSVPREFLGARFDAGLAWVQFPEGCGGLGVPQSFQKRVDAALAAAGASEPAVAKNGIGFGMAAPTIAAFGTEEQKQKFLRPLYIGDHIYCQLFSEPGAGSWVASSRRTRVSRSRAIACSSSVIVCVLAKFLRRRRPRGPRRPARRSNRPSASRRPLCSAKCPSRGA